MGTATILGDDYATIVMPDGKEWLASNLRRSDYGAIVPGDTEADVIAYGRGYLPSELLGWTDLPSGWRIPSESEWNALFTAIGSTYTPTYWIGAGKKLKEAGETHWVYTPTPGTDNYGFAITGSGSWIGPPYFANWQRKKITALASSTLDAGKLVNFQFISSEYDLHLVDGARRIRDALTPSVPIRYAVRLVRDIQYRIYAPNASGLRQRISGLYAPDENGIRRRIPPERAFAALDWLRVPLV